MPSAPSVPSAPSAVGLQNLAAAQGAFYYTLNKLSLGHTNVVKDAIAEPVRELQALNNILPMRREADKAAQDQFMNDDDRFHWYQVLAEKAEKYKTGNCEEHAAVAFMYLRRQNICKIDYCRWKVGFHAFVLIGRGGTGAYDPAKATKEPWFPDAVICDAQDRRWGFWSTLIKYYPADNVFPMLHLHPGRMSTWKNLE